MSGMDSTEDEMNPAARMTHFDRMNFMVAAKYYSLMTDFVLGSEIVR